MLIVYITLELRHWVALRICYLNRVVKDFFSLFEVFCGHDCSSLISICCGKQKSTMSPLRKQGSRAKKLDSRFRGNDKYSFRNRN